MEREGRDIGGRRGLGAAFSTYLFLKLWRRLFKSTPPPSPPLNNCSVVSKLVHRMVLQEVPDRESIFFLLLQVRGSQLSLISNSGSISPDFVPRLLEIYAPSTYPTSLYLNSKIGRGWIVSQATA